MLKYIFAGFLLISTLILPAAANAHCHHGGYGGYGGYGSYGGYGRYYGGGTFIDRLVGNGYGGGWGNRPWNNGYYPGNSYYGHHHHHHHHSEYAYGGWGRRWH